MRSKVSAKFKDMLIYLNINKLRICELKKYKDKRRRNIYKKIKLNATQKREIDDIYKVNYGHKIPYIWHRHFTAFTGKFDKYYFPELLYIPEFEYFENLNKEYCIALQDKNLFPILANNIGIKTPEQIVSCSCGIFRNSDYLPISKEETLSTLKNIGECFLKPSIDSCSGKGCMLLNIKNGFDLKTQKNITEILEYAGENFVVQKIIKCNEDIRKLYKYSVNTFRIITYRWKDEIKYIPSIMRIGRGGKYLDNAHAGGMFIAINNDGFLHRKAFTEFKDEFEYHPDTKIKFDRYKINNFDKVLLAAKNMHLSIPQIGCVNWDFTINDEGNPVLIEANLQNGSIWLSEMAHGEGAFGELTPEILRWIRFMKKCKLEDRKNHMFGKI